MRRTKVSPMKANRQPSNLAMHDGKTNQQRMWECLRNSGGCSSCIVISRKARVHYKTAQRYMDLLVSQGYLESVGSCRGEPIFRLLRDVGIEAPRIKHGRKGCGLQTGVEVMWRTIRILGVFTAGDLVDLSCTSTPVKPSTAQRFLKKLAQAGYLDIVGAIRRGGVTQYRLRRWMNSGPVAPIIQKNGCVFDPNLNEVVFCIGWVGGD